jgi:hypothetical protein
VSRPWALALAACLLGLPTAAVVIRGGATPEADARLKAQAHALALEHPNVVWMQFHAGTGNSQEFGDCTGVYLGLAQDGHTGLILTSAHQWLQSPPELQSILVHFCPGRQSGDYEGRVRAAGLRVVFPFPAALGAAAAASSAASAPAPRAGWDFTRDPDLALVLLDLGPAKAEQLEALGVRPARLYDGDGYRSRPLLDALIVGYGRFATRTSLHLENQRDPAGYAGYTKVTYGTLPGRATFFHLAPFTKAGEALLGPARKDPTLNTYQWRQVDAEETWVDAESLAKVAVRSHPRQALTTNGDSGGPMFLKTSQGLALAGIASAEKGHFLLSPQADRVEQFICQQWEPVKPHLAWIEAVRQGRLGDSRVLDAEQNVNLKKQLKTKDGAGK